MNNNVPAVMMLFIGGLLMYSAVKNKDPRDIILELLGQKPRYGPLSKSETVHGWYRIPGKDPDVGVPPGTQWTSV